MVAPVYLSVPIWTPGVGSLSCQVLGPEQGPPPQEVSRPGYLHEAVLPSFLRVEAPPETPQTDSSRS